MLSKTDIKKVKSTCLYCWVGYGFILQAKSGRLVESKLKVCAARVERVRTRDRQASAVTS